MWLRERGWNKNGGKIVKLGERGAHFPCSCFYSASHHCRMLLFTSEALSEPNALSRSRSLAPPALPSHSIYYIFPLS